jgi:hypothetical protein
MTGSLLFPTLLFLGAAALLAWHMRTWRTVNQQERDETERDFQWRRFRRRMQASGLLALVAVAMAVGVSIPWQRFPSLYVFYWYAVMALVAWLCALAVADVVASRAHLARLRREHLVAQARLAAEVDRHRRRESQQPDHEPASDGAPRRPR